MGKYAQLVIGPAGCGKSTYCEKIHAHCATIGRTVHVVNLDPAAEEFSYPVSIDVRELVTLEDVMDELQLGPNGGLLYCMEYLEDNLDEWLGEELQNYGEDDYLLFDCPGQIELYSHGDTFPSLVAYLKRGGWALAAVYCLDAHFVTDAAKFIAGTLQALSAMVKLELPHINVITKMDLCENKAEVEELLIPNATTLAAQLGGATPPRFQRLNAAVASLVDEYSLVSFVALDITDEDSIAEVLAHVDNSIQYGEDAEVRVRDSEPPDDL